MKAFVTGGAGFIGSHIVDRLCSDNNSVTVYDNLSTGNKKNLGTHLKKITFIQGDLGDAKKLTNAMNGHNIIFHVAALADIKGNVQDPTKCLVQNTISTSNVLEAMKANGIKKIVFASSSTVYGEPQVFPTSEDAPFPIQTSMYGASKVACECLLEAYATAYGFQVFIFRFVSILGERYSHGCIFDFYKKLKNNPKTLEILGNGKQKKSFLYVKDCVTAIFTAISISKEQINIYNLGHDEIIDVDAVASIVCNEMKLKNVKFIHTGGKRGWVGDSPFILLDTKKIRSLGWEPTKSIPDCVRTTLSWLKANEWILDRK